MMVFPLFFFSVFFSKRTFSVLWFIFYMFMMNLYMLKFFLCSGESLFHNQVGLMKVDCSSVIFIVLSFLICVLSYLSMVYDEEKKPQFLLFIFSLMIFFLYFLFSSLNIFFFFVFFELTMFPIFFLIIFWGSYKERVFSLYYFMLFTIITSVPLFLMVSKMYTMGFFDYIYVFLYFPFLSNKFSFLIMLGLLLGFMSKLPIFSLHVWLPKAHVDAPVGGSMILAGVLLKLSGYSVLRLGYIFSYGFIYNMFFFFVMLSIIGYMMTSFFCMRIMDMKVMVAFSSVSHMSLAFSSCISSLYYGLKSSFLMFIGHSVVSPMLFFMVYLCSKLYGSRLILSMKGFSMVFFWMSVFFFVFLLFNLGVPPFINFFAEVSIMMSLFMISKKIFFFVFLGFLFNSLYIFNLLGVFSQSKPIMNKFLFFTKMEGYMFFFSFILFFYMTFFFDFFF